MYHLLSPLVYLEYSHDMGTNVKDTRVYIGLSGGVDSAVSAALLKRAGARVTGVFIKGWYPPGMPCTWALERRDAMRVAAKLHIPFITLDASAEYKKAVIEYLLAEYRVGRTPNPDVMCNREIKFGVFYRFAKASGAEFIATGHYRTGEKDQSYFLWAVPRAILAETLFPLAGMQKSAVRRLARRYKLPVAMKKDSQGVCFLGAVSVKDFLTHEFGANEAILRTIGERVGEGFVVSKNVARKQIVTSSERVPRERMPGRITFSQANWLLAPELVTRAQCRYRGTYVRGVVQGSSFIPHDRLDELPVPGQSIVFFAGTELAGGGIIEP